MEVKKRELEGKFLLAFTAAARGHRVMLGYLHSLLRENLLKPGIFHDKSLTRRPKKLKLLRVAKESGHAFTSIDEEHGLLQKDYATFAGQRYSEETLNLASAVMFWGPHDYAYMARAFPALKYKFHITGNPRVDLWRREFGAIFEEELPLKKPFVLLASNLGSLFGKRQFGEMVSNMRDGYFKGGHDPTEFNLYDHYAYSVLLGAKYIQALRVLSEKYPSINFVLRPHPIESEETWKQLIGSYENILVSNSGSVSPWLRQCTALIHNGCTTAMEAAMSGVPILTYTPIEDQKAEFYFPNRLGKKISNLQSLVENIGQILSGKQSDISSARDSNTLSERFANTDEVLAADRIVDVWERLLQPHHSTKSFWRYGWRSISKGAKNFIDIYRFTTPGLLRFLGEKKPPVLPQKFDPFSLSEIEALCDRFYRQWPSFKNVKVIKVAPRICVFEMKN